MKRIYITAIPLDSNFAITPYAAEPVNYTQTTTQPTCYPITPILADTAHDGDEIKVIAVRQVNSPRSENLEVFRRELDSLGKPYTLVDLTTRESGQVKNARQYDISTLFTLDGIVDMAADAELTDKKAFIKLMLHPDREV